MRLEDYLDFTTLDAIRIKGHRVGIEHVLNYYLEGYPVEDIADEFPGMSLEKIYAVITYYLPIAPASMPIWCACEKQRSRFP